MKTIWQTELMLEPGTNRVRITRRNNKDLGYSEKYTDRRYQMTEASRKRLDETVTRWVNRGLADIQLMGNIIWIEPTC